MPPSTSSPAIIPTHRPLPPLDPPPQLHLAPHVVRLPGFTTSAIHANSPTPSLPTTCHPGDPPAGDSALPSPPARSTSHTLPGPPAISATPTITRRTPPP